MLNRADVGDVVSRARRCFEDGVTRPIAWRERQLDGLLTLFHEQHATLTQALSEDLGRPAQEAWGADIGPVAGELRHLRRDCRRWSRRRRVKLPLSLRPGSGWIEPEPLGVVLVIAPWNYPVQLLVEPLAAAVAAGNAVVAKPSSATPAVSRALAQLIPRYVDRDAIAVVEGPGTGSSLLEQRYDRIIFTGSARVGREVMAAAARHLTPVTLELGGKSPALVDRSADLDVAARRLSWGKWFNAGQTCIAPDYALVHRAVLEPFVDRLQEVVHEFYGLTPIESPDFGRIVSTEEVDRLAALLDGHVPAFGGHVERAQRFVSPTVVVDPPLDSLLMQEEIFGPILPVVPVDSMREAARIVRSRPKPLAQYVFASSESTVDEVLAATSSGGVCINHTLLHALPAGLPFGGVGDSGMGRYHGQAGFDACSNLRPVLRKTSRPDPRLLYPPYSTVKSRFARMIYPA